VIHGVLGEPGEPYVLLFGARGEDTNFMRPREVELLDQRIAAYRSALESGTSLRELGGRLQSELDVMAPRLDALSDERRYADLPQDLRDILISRYRRRVDQLDQMLADAHRGADAAIAARFSPEGQQEHQEVAERRGQVEQERHNCVYWRLGVHQHLRAYRQRLRGHPDRLGHLEGSVAAAEFSYSSAETQWQQAQTELAQVRANLPPEDEARRRYRAALHALELASNAYVTARDGFLGVESAYGALILPEPEPEPVEGGEDAPEAQAEHAMFTEEQIRSAFTVSFAGLEVMRGTRLTSFSGLVVEVVGGRRRGQGRDVVVLDLVIRRRAAQAWELRVGERRIPNRAGTRFSISVRVGAHER
jgi:hypothetical protein